jgi:hypothetical protein
MDGIGINPRRGNGAKAQLVFFSCAPIVPENLSWCWPIPSLPHSLKQFQVRQVEMVSGGFGGL